MVWRSRVMCTRSSRAASSAGDGARICTGAGVATGVGAAAARSIAASMSPLVTWPRMPEPSTLAASTPLSAAILRTDGGSGISAGFAAGGIGGCGVRARLGGGFAARRWRGRLVRAAAAAGAVRDLAEQRADGDRVAGLRRDVGQDAGGGRRHFQRDLVGFQLDQRLVHRDASPGCLNHLPTVASVTDSPRVGTRMSAMVQPFQITRIMRVSPTLLPAIA